MFKLKPTDISVLGSGMQRPECVLATKSGDLICSDSRGGYNIVKPDGAGQFIKARGAPDDFMPNGIALLPNRDVLAANLAESSGVWLIKPDGETSLFLSEIDGVQLPPPNFVGLDSKSRIWITVSTRVSPRGASFKKGFADGFVAVHDDRGTRIVADNIGYTNEGIVDPSGQWFYVNETVAQRTSRYAIKEDASLGARETVAEYPPATYPDGFTFDSQGGIWLVSVASNRVIHVDRDGRQNIVVEDADPAEMERIAAAFDDGSFDREMIEIGSTRPLRNIASIGFGGADLHTVYMGSLSHEGTQTFRSPIKGAPLVHWEF
jgi:sugar lactone lactonase YvrE